MADKLLPCKCGYVGKLQGADNGLWLELKCPQCDAVTSAFTPDGLVETWNEKAVAALSETAPGITND